MKAEEIKKLAEAGADFSKISLRGANISFIDFERAKNLSPENFFSAAQATGCKLPQDMDFSSFSLEGKNARCINFGRAKNLSAQNLLSAKDVSYCRLPPGMDFANASLAGKNVKNIDFAKAKNLTAQNLFSASDFSGCALPPDMKMDFKNISLKGKNAGFIDFSRAKNLSAQNLFSARNASGCKLPPGIDFANVSLAHKKADCIDFSRAENLELNNLLSALDIGCCIVRSDIKARAARINISHAKFRTKLNVLEPNGKKTEVQLGEFARAKGIEVCLIERKDVKILAKSGADFSNVSLTGLDVNKVDFSRAKNLAAADLFSANNVSGCVLPPGMDFADASLEEKFLDEIDFSLAKNLSAQNLFSAHRVWKCKLPPDMDFKDAPLGGKEVQSLDFSLAKNLTAQNLFSAAKLSGLDTFFAMAPCIMPPGMDFAEVPLKDKDVRGIDFTRAKNLTLGNLLSARRFEKCIIRDDIPVPPLRSNISKLKLDSKIFVAISGKCGEPEETTPAEFAARKGDPDAMRYVLLKKFGE
ncbi:MAG: hypothetical protein IKO42_02810 [Opitutales bacterium]|nr:hypothetical protein [Opitutales bacterium]